MTRVELFITDPYKLNSPDLNQIEQMWGKVKNYLRKEAARTLGKFAILVKAVFMGIKC